MNEPVAYEKKNWVKYAIFILVGTVIVYAALIYFQGPKPIGAMGEDIQLSVYTRGFGTTGGMVSIPFQKDYPEGVYLNAAVDFNSDGQFNESEWLVRNSNATTQQGWNVNLPFKSGIRFADSVKVRVVMSPRVVEGAALTKPIRSGDWLEKTVSISRYDMNELLGSTPPTNPTTSMKEGQATGPQAQAAPASGLPDFGQRIAECGPTVAANGLYSLAMKNGASDKLPKDPREMIDGLKGDMQWTPADGVVTDNFVAGKDKWAVTHGLPIKTEMIGGDDGRGTLDEIKKALAGGAAVEVRLRFFDADVKVSGGHVVTVAGVREVAGQTILDIHDPLSPTGTDSYPISLGSLSNYPYHDGEVAIGIAFSQVWQGPPMGGQLDPMTEDEMRGIREFAGEKKTIKAIHVGDKYIPLTEVHLGKGEHCDSEKDQFPHWHANNGSSATATDGTKVPDAVECGYGKAINVPVEDVIVP